MREAETTADDQPADELALTVVIPAYNAARTLGQQLDALAAQSAPFAWEVVVADNGSTDGTRAVAAAAIGRVPGLRLIDASAKRGAGAARNAGVAAARGRAVAFCDADDVVGEGWVAAMGAGLAAHASVAGRNDWSLLNSRAVLGSRIQDGVDHLEVSPDGLHLNRAGTNNLGIRTDVFRRAGGFDLEAPAMEDIDLVWRIQLAGDPLVFLPDALVHVRMRSGLRSLMSQARAYGDGERWLDERYRELRAAAAGAPGGSGEAVADLDVPAVPVDSPRTVGRVVRRLSRVAQQAATVRRRGDLYRLCFELAFGVGYAHGSVARTGAAALPAALAAARHTAPQPTPPAAVRREPDSPVVTGGGATSSTVLTW